MAAMQAINVTAVMPAFMAAFGAGKAAALAAAAGGGTSAQARPSMRPSPQGWAGSTRLSFPRIYAGGRRRASAMSGSALRKRAAACSRPAGAWAARGRTRTGAVIPRPPANREQPRCARAAQVLEGALLPHLSGRGDRGLFVARHAGRLGPAPAQRRSPGLRRGNSRPRGLRSRFQPSRHDVRIRRCRWLVEPRGGQRPDRGGPPLRCRARALRQRRIRQFIERRGRARRRAGLPARQARAGWQRSKRRTTPTTSST